jgi:hypothetical protein
VALKRHTIGFVIWNKTVLRKDKEMIKMGTCLLKAQDLLNRFQDLTRCFLESVIYEGELIVIQDTARDDDETRQVDKARQGKARQDKTRQDQARQGETKKDKRRQDKVKHGRV